MSQKIHFHPRLPPGRDSAEGAELAARLRTMVQGEVLFDAGARGRYSTDASIYQVLPVGVLVPRTEDDVRAALALCRELRVPVLPRGAGSSQCGQAVGRALIIDHTKFLAQIIAFDRTRAVVEVQPGLVLDRLNDFLKPHGLWFPVDVSTSAQATLGGMAGNNSCGSRSIAYGNMVHNVHAIDALLADGSEARFGPHGASPSAASTHRIAQLEQRLHEIGAAERDEIERMWPRVLRRVGGYNLDLFHPRSERPYTADNSVNLAHLLVGSEGTLASFRRLHLQLAPIPAQRVLGVVNFASFQRAMELAQHIVRLAPTAVELVDRTMLELARGNPAFRPTIERALVGGGREALPEAILLVEFAGDERDALLARLRGLVTLMADLGVPGSVVELTEAAQQRALWEVRKAGLNIMMSLRGDGKPVSFVEDCAVPLEHLAEYTARLTEVFARHGTRGTWYAHASVGTLHVRPILDLRRAGPNGGAQKMRAIAAEAAALVRQFKGAYSGEHGDGLVRSEWVAWQFGPRLTRAFEQIKDLFDPDGVLNPGKIVRPALMDDANLFRYPPGYAVRPLATALDWSAWDVNNDDRGDGGGDHREQRVSPPGTGSDPAAGFGKAVEMCNNNGHCRQFDAGTMCPSFRVTHDEQHLTRGRTNTLRLALSGQLGPDALASDEMFATMDLCVSCKGCKRDCPTGVDLARMKIEFLHHYRQRRGIGVKERLIAYLPRYAPWAARWPALANARDAWPALARMAERMTGLSAQRSWPRWRGDPFLRRAVASNDERRASARRVRAEPPSGASSHIPGQDFGAGLDAVLFVDTFSNYFEPEIAHAALRVLNAAGLRVRLARPARADAEPNRPLCCGRTFLAVGLVDQARREAQRMIEALAPFAEHGVPIVGLEPSCVLGLRDEYQVLRLGERARLLGEQTFLFEEFLVRAESAGRLSLPLRAIGTCNALLHGHCHQKAFDALTPSRQVLGWIPGLSVRTIESSCCGMAGSFGYEAAHYDVSLKMAELSLLPALRAADGDTIFVADGTSCRTQIAHGLNGNAAGQAELKKRRALHVAEVLASALAS